MDTLSQDLLTELECPVCFETMLPPIRLCLEGHSLCNYCRKKLDRCPTCRKPLTDARNRALEKVAEKLNPVQANATSSYESTSSSVEVTSGTTRATVRDEYQSLRTNQPNISASENTEESLFNEYEDVDEDDDDDDNGGGDDDDDSSDESDIETEVIEDDEWFNTIENFTTENSEHRGVWCDVCRNGVEGYRYKCIQCPDYDLCANCEGARHHVDHYMLRMPAPAFWCQHFGRILARRLSNETDNICRINDLLLQDDAVNVEHRGVSCDGCNVALRGFRYKCIQCRDFDLCAKCEARGIHISHFMIRMPLPTIWDTNYGRSLAYYLKRYANKICSHSRRLQGELHKNFGGSHSKELKVNNVHLGITCDSCYSNVKGFRYKCLECPDFDLCSQCETLGIHKEHYFLRMPDIKYKCQHFGRRLARLLCSVYMDCCNLDGRHRLVSPKHSGGMVHRHVMCDQCSSEIIGFRYKCVECDNYDLCSACESIGVHKKHFMIRMPVPTTLCQQFTQHFEEYLRMTVCSMCSVH